MKTAGRWVAHTTIKGKSISLGITIRNGEISAMCNGEEQGRTCDDMGDALTTIVSAIANAANSKQ